MALAAVQPAMNHEDNQSVHPFFSKPLRKGPAFCSASELTCPGTPAPLADLSPNETPTNDLHDDPDYEHLSTEAQPAKIPKKRTRKTEDVKEKREKREKKLHARNQASLDMFTRPARTPQEDDPADVDIVQATLIEDPNLDRRKRRKTESPGPVDASTTTQPSMDVQQQFQAQIQMPSMEATSTVVPDVLLVEDSTVLLRSASPVHSITTMENPRDHAGK
jgi:hypothetical protein